MIATFLPLYCFSSHLPATRPWASWRPQERSPFCQPLSAEAAMAATAPAARRNEVHLRMWGLLPDSENCPDAGLLSAGIHGQGRDCCRSSVADLYQSIDPAASASRATGTNRDARTARDTGRPSCARTS